MAKTRKLIQQRPNTGVEFYVPADNIISIINDNGGNFQQVTSEDGLTNTIKSDTGYGHIEENTCEI